VDPRRAGDLRPQRQHDQHLEHDHAHGQGGGGVAPLVPQRVPVGRHQQDEQDQAEQDHPGEYLGAGQQLGGRDRAEAHPEPDRRPALAVQDLVEQDEQPWQEEDQDQVGVVGMADHRRREAVDQPAAGGRAVAGHIAVDREIGAPGREAVGEGDEHVEGQHRAEEQGQRRQQQARQRQPGVPHEVDAVGVVEVVAGEGRDVAPGRERRPAQEPGEQPGVADAGPERPGRRRGPDGPEQQPGQPEERQQHEQLDADGPHPGDEAGQGPAPGQGRRGQGDRPFRQSECADFSHFARPLRVVPGSGGCFAFRRASSAIGRMEFILGIHCRGTLCCRPLAVIQGASANPAYLARGMHGSPPST